MERLPLDVLLEIISTCCGHFGVPDLDELEYHLPAVLLVLPLVCKRFYRAVMTERAFTYKMIVNFRCIHPSGKNLPLILQEARSLSLMQWLFSYLKQLNSNFVSIDLRSLWRCAAHCGDFAMLKWVQSQGQKNQFGWEDEFVISGNLDVLDWVLSFPIAKKKPRKSFDPIMAAISFGTPEVLNRLLETQKKVFPSRGEIFQRIRYQSVTMFRRPLSMWKYLIERLAPFSPEEESVLIQSADDVASVHVVSLLHGKSPVPFSQHVLETVAEFCPVATLQYLDSKRCAFPSNLVDFALKGFRAENVRWCLEQGFKFQLDIRLYNFRGTPQSIERVLVLLDTPLLQFIVDQISLSCFGNLTVSSLKLFLASTNFRPNSDTLLRAALSSLSCARETVRFLIEEAHCSSSLTVTEEQQKKMRRDVLKYFIDNKVLSFQ